MDMTLSPSQAHNALMAKWSTFYSQKRLNKAFKYFGYEPATMSYQDYSDLDEMLFEDFIAAREAEFEDYSYGEFSDDFPHLKDDLCDWV